MSQELWFNVSSTVYPILNVGVLQLLLSDRVAIHCFVNTLSCQRTQHNVLAKVKPRPFDLSQVVKSWVKITKDYYKIDFRSENF